MATQSTNQELFERIRLLVVQHGTHEDVDALHELRERFNRLAAAASSPNHGVR